MILGNLKDADRYKHLHPLFTQALEYIASHDFAMAEAGVTELQGKDLFVIVSDTDLRSSDEAKLEVHNKYIDIQMPISKKESFGWKSRAEVEQVIADFDEEKDIQFFDDAYSSQFSLQASDFVIFYPEDAHAPCVGEGKIRKVIVKVKL